MYNCTPLSGSTQAGASPCISNQLSFTELAYHERCNKSPPTILEHCKCLVYIFADIRSIRGCNSHLSSYIYGALIGVNDLRRSGFELGLTVQTGCQLRLIKKS